MNESVKRELHTLIENCNNEILLKEATQLLKSDCVDDWWDDLTEEDKFLINESEEDYKKGNFVTHNNLMQAWKKK